MKNIELEQKLKTAVEHSVPDVLDNILSQCEEQKGIVIQMDTEQKKKRRRMPLVAAAAAFLLLIGGAVGYNQVQANAVDAVVALDVNPSIELSVSRGERILEAKALNEDASVILDGMDLKNTDLDVAVNAIIGSMMKHGFINEMANSILVSVENADTKKGTEMQQRLVKEIDQLLRASSVEGAILSQTVNKEKDPELVDMANKYDVSLGKASLIREILAQNSLLTIDDLKGLNINELNLLTNSKSVKLQDIKSTGKASDKAYIGEAEAKRLALKHAGIAASAATYMEVEIDAEHGTMVYDIEFYAGNIEYDYEIDAKTGSVVKAEKQARDDHDDYDDDYDDHDDRNNDDDDRATPAKPTGTAAGTENYIGESKAKSTALKHAGISASSATGMYVKLDRDDGTMVYEVEFYAEDTEYDYEINAVTGSVVKATKQVGDNDDDHNDNDDDHYDDNDDYYDDNDNDHDDDNDRDD